MSVLDGIEPRIDAILTPIFGSSGHVERSFHSNAELRAFLAQITQTQKSLRLLKAEVSNEMKQVSMTYSDKITNTSHPVLGFLIGQRRAGHVSAIDRQRHRHNRQAALAPYHNATTYINQCIGRLDQIKIDLQQQALHPVMEYTCNHCGYRWTAPGDYPAPESCPRCGR